MENVNPLITILAIKEDIKPIGRIDCFLEKDLDFYIEKMRNFSLYYKIVSKSENVKSEKVKKHIYFSKYKKNKEKINRLIKLYKGGNYNNETFAKANKEMGKIYGYPNCCINWFIDFLSNWFIENEKSKIKLIEPSHSLIILKILSNSKVNLFDKVVNCCQNDNPISHLPHSFKCRKSINIGRENLKILKKYNKELFLKYDKYLKGAFRVYKNRIVKIADYYKSSKNNNFIYFK